MIFELFVGLVVLGMIAFAALFFTKQTRRRNDSSNLTGEQPCRREDGVEKPRNKANMDQPQEEFIAPEGAHANVDGSRER